MTNDRGRRPTGLLRPAEECRKPLIKNRLRPFLTARSGPRRGSAPDSTASRPQTAGACLSQMANPSMIHSAEKRSITNSKGRRQRPFRGPFCSLIVGLVSQYKPIAGWNASDLNPPKRVPSLPNACCDILSGATPRGGGLIWSRRNHHDDSKSSPVA